MVAQTIAAHGYMISPNGLNGAFGAVRGYGGSIDTLQNPGVGKPKAMCLGLGKSKISQVSFGGNGASHTVGLSISARHPGPCSMEIIDPATQKIVEIGSQMNCATLSPSSVRFDWTFKLKNMDQVTCTECILRFVWSSSNLIPTEYFQTCADIRRVGGGGVKTYRDCKTAGMICAQQCGTVMIQCTGLQRGNPIQLPAGTACRNGMIDHAAGCT
ncbi:hypothetical protein BDR26DRAFT_849245 [Obelidium mucronatum]|nr:hypothetical protein BDR26DRAFT_849245 [Obelidium mucronatum]